MDINQAARLLNEVNIKTICGTNLIQEYHEQNENYYRLGKKDENWVFLFVKGEKKTVEEEEIQKTFDNESDASKYYYLFELSRYYFEQYINPFEIKNKDINIGETECTILNLKEAFDRIGIKEIYYDFNNLIKEHSICLEEIDNNTSEVKFIGNGKKIIFQTLRLEKWLAYYATYKFTYYLFLLDRHCELLIKNKEVESPFTDEEYSIFLK